MSGIAFAPPRTRRARPLIHGSSSSASRASAASRSRTRPPRLRGAARGACGSSRSPMESRASIACARISASSEWRQRRMTPPASGTPSTTRAWRASPMCAPPSGEDRQQVCECRFRVVPSGIRGSQDRPRTTELRGPLEPAERPCDDRIADLGAVTAERLRAASCARFEPLDRTSSKPAGVIRGPTTPGPQSPGPRRHRRRERGRAGCRPGPGPCLAARQRRQGGGPDRCLTDRRRAGSRSAGIVPPRRRSVSSPTSLPYHPGGQQSHDDLGRPRVRPM